MNDAEFLDYLETKLGQRWSKQERHRFLTIRPHNVPLWYISSTVVAKQQKQNIDQVREELHRRAIKRLEE